MRNLLEKYLIYLLKKRIGTKTTRVHKLGGKVVEIDDIDPKKRRVTLISILPKMLNINLESDSKDFENYANLIAKKYLATRFIRNRVIFIIHFDEKDQKYIGIIASILTDEEFRKLDVSSHNIKLDIIKNYLPDKIKKGAIFPFVIHERPELNKIKIIQENYADYFPNSLETIPELTKGEQYAVVASLIHQISEEKKENFTTESIINFSQEIQKIPQDQIKFKDIDNAINKISDKDIELNERLTEITNIHEPILEKFKEIGQFSKNIMFETKIEIIMEDFKINFPSKYINEKRILIFEKEGKYFITLEGMNPRIKSDGKEIHDLDPISWNKFIKIMEGSKN